MKRHWIAEPLQDRRLVSLRDKESGLNIATITHPPAVSVITSAPALQAALAGLLKSLYRRGFDPDQADEILRAQKVLDSSKNL
jgi:hypothetical protein